MADIDRTPTPSRLRRLTGGLGLAMLGSLAVLALAVAILPRSTPPVAVVPTPVATPVASDPGVGPGMAMCIRYDTATLAGLEFAFDGVVSAVDGDQVSFEVTKAFKGPAGTVTVTAAGQDGSTITLDGLQFKVGERYLVTGSDATAWACGYSQPYDAAVAAEWETVFDQ